jgi:hypothetical protein
MVHQKLRELVSSFRTMVVVRKTGSKVSRGGWSSDYSQHRQKILYSTVVQYCICRERSLPPCPSKWPERLTRHWSSHHHDWWWGENLEWKREVHVISRTSPIIPCPQLPVLQRQPRNVIYVNQQSREKRSVDCDLTLYQPFYHKVPWGWMNTTRNMHR